MVVAGLTAIGLAIPVPFRVMRDIYLLEVIGLSLRVGRSAALFAALASGVVWNFVFLPPQFAFPILSIEDGLTLLTYFVVALTSGEMTTRLRASEARERQRKEHATTLLAITRTLVDGSSLDEALVGVLGLGDRLFRGRTALLLWNEKHQALELFHGSSFLPPPAATATITQRLAEAEQPSHWTVSCGGDDALCAPLKGSNSVLGAFVVVPPGPAGGVLSDEQQDLLHAFSTQISLVIEREHLREARARERLLAESDRLRRTLLDSVSHELKTPLAVLRSAAECLKNDQPAQRGVLAEEIDRATRRLDRLVANLLNQARLEAGAIQPQLDWCDPRDIVATVRRGLAEALSQHRLTVDIAPDVPLVKVDAPLLEQAVENLLLNAAHHTPPGTSLDLSVGVDQSNRRVLLRVADRGPGIPADLRASLFQKFRRGKATTVGGVGLGLSIVRGFVEAQGGEVVADDNPGGGARFTIFLPLLVPDSAPEE